MNCSDCQNLMLQNKTGFEKHVKTCDECRSFLSLQKNLQQLEPKKEKYPGKVLFEELWEKAPDKHLPVFSLKWAIPLAASFLLIISIFSYTNSIQKEQTGKDVLSISNAISTGINDLDQDILDMETSLLTADFIGNEIESLMEEIENFS